MNFSTLSRAWTLVPWVGHEVSVDQNFFRPRFPLLQLGQDKVKAFPVIRTCSFFLLPCKSDLIPECWNLRLWLLILSVFINDVLPHCQVAWVPVISYQYLSVRDKKKKMKRNEKKKPCEAGEFVSVGWHQSFKWVTHLQKFSIQPKQILRVSQQSDSSK